jgi:hypothetical protein
VVLVDPIFKSRTTRTKTSTPDPFKTALAQANPVNTHGMASAIADRVVEVKGCVPKHENSSPITLPSQSQLARFAGLLENLPIESCVPVQADSHSASRFRSVRMVCVHVPEQHVISSEACDYFHQI